MSLLKSTAVGVLWSGLSQFSILIFQYVIMIILARLLAPEDFGIIGMAVIFIGLVQTINELGLSASIIQKKDITNSHLSTSFWISLGLGIILFILTIIISPYVADFFQNELVGPVISVLSSNFIFGSCGAVHRALLQKNIDFKKIAFVEITSSALSGIFSIILALFGFNVWSLVFGTVLNYMVRVVLLWKVCTWRPSVVFDIRSFKELYNFGVNVMGSRFLNYIDSNVDYFFIGKFLSSAALGHYTFAYQLSTFPLAKISSIVTSVTFPTFSLFQEDNEKLKYAYLKVVKYISLITFPMLAGLFIVAPEFIPIVFGEKWIPMIKSLQILCVLGALQSVGTTVGCILLSKGRADIQFKWNIFTSIILTIAVIIGIEYGITGVALSITLTSCIIFFIIQKITNDLIGLSILEYLKALYTGTIGSIILILVIWTFHMSNIFTYMTITSLIFSIFIGIVSYIVTVKTVDSNCIEEIISLCNSIKK